MTFWLTEKWSTEIIAHLRERLEFKAKDSARAAEVETAKLIKF